MTGLFGRVKLDAMRFVLSIVLIVLYSCSSSKPQGKTAAEVLYKEAQVFIEAKRYILATEKLNQLRSQYPYSFYATHAELLQADILFLQENYVEAAAAYILFRDFHPRYKRLPYVVWKIAESFYKQIPDTIDRDLSPAKEAIKYFKEVVRRYPRSTYAETADEKVAEATNMLNQKERYIADFYFKTKEYSSARYRYLSIIKNISDGELQDHSKVRVVRSSQLLGEFEKCLEYGKNYLSTISDSSKRLMEIYMGKCKARL